MSDDNDDFDWTSPLLDILHAPDVEPDWLIKDLMLQGTLVILAGEPAAGKSYVSYTLGMAVASGVSALSGIVPPAEPRRVVYFDQENSPQNRDKYITRSWHGLVDNTGSLPDDVVLYDHFYPVSFRLGTEDWDDEAMRFIDRFEPHMVVFDTAASAFAIADENDNAEASRVIGRIRHLMTRTNPMMTAVVLKHANSTLENGRRRIRGATMWQSLADQVMFQVRSQGRPPTKRGKGLHITKMVPDKTRAYGLTDTIKIIPSWTDEAKTGLMLEAKIEEHNEGEDDE